MPSDPYLLGHSPDINSAEGFDNIVAAEIGVSANAFRHVSISYLLDQEILATLSSSVAQLGSERASATLDDDQVATQIRSGVGEGVASIIRDRDVRRSSVDGKVAGDVQREEGIVGDRSMAVAQRDGLS